jgi:hypothetical protein
MTRRSSPFRFVPFGLFAAAWAAWLPIVGLRAQGGEIAEPARTFWSIELVVGWEFGARELQP